MGLRLNRRETHKFYIRNSQLVSDNTLNYICKFFIICPDSRSPFYSIRQVTDVRKIISFYCLVSIDLSLNYRTSTLLLTNVFFSGVPMSQSFFIRQLLILSLSYINVHLLVSCICTYIYRYIY